MSKAKQDSPKADDSKIEQSLRAETTVATIGVEVEGVIDSNDAEELEAKQDSPKADDSDADGDSSANHVVSVTVEHALDQLQATDGEFVKVLIKYPEDWSKSKFFVDGETKEVHKNNAEVFIRQCIATIVTE